MQKILKIRQTDLRYGRINPNQPKIFDLLTPKVMLNIGQNYQLYISISITYDQFGSCKKF